MKEDWKYHKCPILTFDLCTQQSLTQFYTTQAPPKFYPTFFASLLHHNVIRQCISHSVQLYIAIKNTQRLAYNLHNINMDEHESFYWAGSIQSLFVSYWQMINIIFEDWLYTHWKRLSLCTHKSGNSTYKNTMMIIMSQDW